MDAEVRQVSGSNDILNRRIRRHDGGLDNLGLDAFFDDAGDRLSDGLEMLPRSGDGGVSGPSGTTFTRTSDRTPGWAIVHPLGNGIKIFLRYSREGLALTGAG